MTQSVAQKTSIPEKTWRRQTDSPIWWTMAACGSAIMHLLVFWLLSLYELNSSRQGRFASALPIEFIEISRQKSPPTKQNPKPKSVLPKPSNNQANRAAKPIVTQNSRLTDLPSAETTRVSANDRGAIAFDINRQIEQQLQQQRLAQQPRDFAEIQGQLEAQQRQREAERQRQLEAQQRQREAERQRQLEAQQRLLAEQLRQREAQQRQLEAQLRQQEAEQQRRLAQQLRQREAQQRQLEEAQLQREAQQRQLEEAQRQREAQQRQLEQAQRQQEEERQRQLEAQRQREEDEQQRQLEAQRQRELQQRQLEQAQRQREEDERQRQLEAQRQQEAQQRQQRLVEKLRQREPEQKPIPPITPPEQPGGRVLVGDGTSLEGQVITASWKVETNTFFKDKPDNLAKPKQKINTNIPLPPPKDDNFQAGDFLVWLIIDNQGNLISVEVDKQIPVVQRGQYQEYAEKIFKGQKFIPASGNNGNKPDLSYLPIRVNVQNVSN